MGLLVLVYAVLRFLLGCSIGPVHGYEGAPALVLT